MSAARPPKVAPGSQEVAQERQKTSRDDQNRHKIETDDENVDFVKIVAFTS